jgi:hypothetical protein
MLLEAKRDVRATLLLVLGFGLVGCAGSSTEQRCFEAQKAVAESLEKAAESRGGVNSEWVTAMLAAREWKEAECASFKDKVLHFLNKLK